MTKHFILWRQNLSTEKKLPNGWTIRCRIRLIYMIQVPRSLIERFVVLPANNGGWYIEFIAYTRSWNIEVPQLCPTHPYELYTCISIHTTKLFGGVTAIGREEEEVYAASTNIIGRNIPPLYTVVLTSEAFENLLADQVGMGNTPDPRGLNIKKLCSSRLIALIYSIYLYKSIWQIRDYLFSIDTPGRLSLVELKK